MQESSRSPSPSSVRRQHQAHALEFLDDLNHELDVVLVGSSPETRIYKQSVIERTIGIKRRFPEVQSPPAISTSSGPVLSIPASAPVSATKTPKVSKLTLTQKAQARFDKLLESAYDTPLTKEDYMVHIQTPGKDGGREGREDAALTCLLNGYGSGEGEGEWVNVFSSSPQALIDSDSSSTELTLRSNRQWQALAYNNQRQETRNLPDFILHHISVADFAFDWRELKGKNSRKVKQDFYEAIFQALDENEEFFRLLDTEERSRAMSSSHAVIYEDWHSKQEGIITARNRFVDVYLAVVWSNRLPGSFLERGVKIGILPATARYDDLLKAVFGVTAALGVEVSQCLKGFFTAHPDKVPGLTFECGQFLTLIFLTKFTQGIGLVYFLVLSKLWKHFTTPLYMVDGKEVLAIHEIITVFQIQEPASRLCFSMSRIKTPPSNIPAAHHRAPEADLQQIYRPHATAAWQTQGVLTGP
ncbi:hypothetical protein C8R43DRAFT_944463 [Mycena crocata]|nr:hypothetical protein C8R43DRAFT_944463 [Mycena crocata]